MRETYTSQDLSNLLELAVKNIIAKAKRENWQSIPRKGRGGGHEWLISSMSEETRYAIQLAESKVAIQTQNLSTLEPPQTLSLLDSKLDYNQVDNKRRTKASAKADLLRKYTNWQHKYGFTVTQKESFVEAYNKNTWPELREILGEISWKSLERWKTYVKDDALALVDKRGFAHRGKSMLTETHKSIILSYILSPNAPKISFCARDIQKKCRDKGLQIPSEPTLRRFVRDYETTCYDEFTLWRQGKKAWNDACAISIVRDWSQVEVGDVIFADGHTLNFETINPETGKAKRMTLLLFYDGASNHPLGWEIMASENTACISSAFRRSIIALGKMPRVVYIDNGKAFRAKFFKGCNDLEQAGIFGLYENLGCEVIHAWAYHGQSKPVERFFGTLLELENMMPSYTGYDIAHKPARMNRGEDLHRKLYEKMGFRPLTLEETHIVVARWFADYCQRPQRGHLKGIAPATVFNQGRGTGLTAEEIAKLDQFMMQTAIRTITKDGFKFRGKLFWHEALTGRRHSIVVRYDDQYEPNDVKVYTVDGKFICTAQNREHYRIAYGVHPVAKVLGTEEQKRELEEAIALKKNQEAQSSAMMKAMLESIVLPESRAKMAAIENSVTKAENVSLKSIEMSDFEKEAVYAAQRKGLEAAKVKPTYMPSSQKYFGSEYERYNYLFTILYEQKIELIPEDIAYMNYFENLPSYQRNFKKRFEDLRGVYEMWDLQVAQNA